MRRHLKASAVGSALRRTGARLPVAAACLLVSLAFAGIGASSAGAVPLGVTGYVGNPGATGETAGGRFGVFTSGQGLNKAPAAVAIRNSNGDYYVADAANNRIQQFHADGSFVRAWGFDVVSAGAPNNGNEMQTVRVNAGAGKFKLVFGLGGPGISETGDLPYDATAAEVQTALNALENIETVSNTGSVSVSGGPGDNGGNTPYLVNFNGGPWNGTDVTTAFSGVSATSPNELSGGSGVGANAVTISTFNNGGGAATGFEICDTTTIPPNTPAQCKAGTSSVLGGSVKNADGIAVNQTTGDVYVTTGQGLGPSVESLVRVDQFDARGNFIRSWGGNVVSSGPGDSSAANAVQELNASAGGAGNKYKLNFEGQVSGEIEVGSGKAATIQTELRALSFIGAGTGAANVNVTEPSAGSGIYKIEFVGQLANNPEPLITTTAGSPAASPLPSITETTAGSTGFEICTAAAVCRAGETTGRGGAFANNRRIGYLAVAPNGNVLVPESQSSKVSEFTASGTFIRSFGWGVVAMGPSNSAETFEICRASAFDACKTGVNGSPAGALGSFGANDPSRIAVDSNGAIYTVESGTNFRVQKFTPSGGNLVPSLFNPTINSLPGETPAASFPLSGASAADSPVGIAVDPVDDHVYVLKPCTAAHCPGASSPTELRVYEFDPAGSGTLVDTHLASYGITAANGFALRAGGLFGNLTSFSPKAGVYQLGEPVPPTVTIEATTGVEPTCATLHGKVNPNGGTPLTTSYRFEYSGNGGSSWSQVPASPVDIGSDETDVAVQQTPCGLEPNKDYTVRLVAIKGGSSTLSIGSAGDFQTAAAPPITETFAAYWDWSAEELVLRGGVNPNNTVTEYWFEYGTEPCSPSACEESTAPLSGGSGGQSVERVERLSGLQPNTTYHYRVVADNGVAGSPAIGAETTVSTPDYLAACANETRREESNSTGLGECRGFEQASNGDSGGSGAWSFERVGADGDRVQFRAQVFNEPPSSPGYVSPYVAVRGDDRWSVRSASPSGGMARVGGGSAYSFASSSDLTETLWPAASAGQEYRGEVQWTITNLDGSSRTAAPLLVPLLRTGPVSKISSYSIPGSAPDLSTFVFQRSNEQGTSGLTLLPGELLLLGKSSNLYEIAGTNGPNLQLRVINRTNGVGGAVIGGTCGAGLGSSLVGAAFEGFTGSGVSEDGSVVYFSAIPGATVTGPNPCRNAEPDKRLFKRIDGSETVEVSACTKTTPPCGGTNGADEYKGASADGEVVFFTTPRQLTDSDSDSTNDLYVYDEDPPGTGQPKLVQASAGEEVSGGHPTIGSGAEVLDVLATSADGSRAYFTAKGRLTAAATKNATNLYVYERDAAEEAGRIAFVAKLTGAAPNRNDYAALPALEGGDGHLLVFATTTPLLAEDRDARRDVYRYNDESGDLICASCMGGEAFDVAFMTGLGAVRAYASASDDASTIAFGTEEGLLADDDLNGAPDVYVWRRGALGLASAGSDQLGVSFTSGFGADGGVSADGRDVFFMTRVPLIDADINNALDVYDARIGGGFPLPAAPPHCAGADECQGQQGEPPLPSSPASPSFAGSGNVQAPKPCGKGKVRRHGKCVVRHERNKGKKHKHRAKKHQRKGKVHP